MITKNYILMCEQAEEIQRLFNPNGHNLLWDYALKTGWDRDKFRYKSYKKCGDKKEHTFEDIIDGYIWGCIWLPTQEQLQEMVNAYSSYERINRFYEFVHLDAHEYGYNKWCEFVNDASMNELWLIYVMKEKYNKIWTGEKWEKIK